MAIKLVQAHSASPHSPRLSRVGGECLAAAAILLLTVAAGLWLRLASINESLWIDELHTAWVVLGDWPDIAPRALLGNNSPWYFYLVHGLAQWLGTEEWALRSISLAAGIGLMVATYAVARHWKCPPACALLAAALVAVDSHAIFYSTEARTYALVQLVSLIHLFLFVQVLVARSQLGWWTGWVATGLVLFHLHCTTALIFAAEVLAYLTLLLVARTDVKASPHTLLLGCVLVLMGMLPAMELIGQLAERRENWAQFVKRVSVFQILTIYPLYLYLLAPMVGGVLVQYVFQRRASPRPPDKTHAAFRQHMTVPMIACIAWLFVPVLAAWLLTELEIASLFSTRYVVASSASLALLAGLLTSWLLPAGRAAWGVATIVLVVALLNAKPAHRGEDWRAAIAELNASPEIPLIFYSGLIEADDWHASPIAAQREYLRFPLRGVYPLRPDRHVISLPRTTGVEFLAQQRGQLASGGAELLIRGSSRVGEIKSRVLAALGKDFTIGQTRTYGKVAIVRIHSRRP